jgi:hypothetical protein
MYLAPLREYPSDVHVLTRGRLHAISSRIRPRQESNIPRVDRSPIIRSDHAASHRVDNGLIDTEMGAEAAIPTAVLGLCRNWLVCPGLGARDRALSLPQ